MTTPTPSLPAAIREALDDYQRTIIRAHSTLRGHDFVAEEDARTALEAHLLALVADAAIGKALRSTLATANGARLCIHDFVSGSDVSFDDTFGPPTTDATRALETALRATPHCEKP